MVRPPGGKSEKVDHGPGAAERSKKCAVRSELVSRLSHKNSCLGAREHTSIDQLKAYLPRCPPSTSRSSARLRDLRPVPLPGPPPAPRRTGCAMCAARIGDRIAAARAAGAGRARRPGGVGRCLDPRAARGGAARARLRVSSLSLCTALAALCLACAPACGPASAWGARRTPGLSSDSELRGV